MTRALAWTTALSEAKSASRHLAQALRLDGAPVARAQALRETQRGHGAAGPGPRAHGRPRRGSARPPGGAGLRPRDGPGLRRTAEILLDRLATSLGLEQTGERGELLRLLPEDLAEFDLRGPEAAAGDNERGLYCVVRPGWSLDAHIVVRPLVEAVSR